MEEFKMFYYGKCLYVFVHTYIRMCVFVYISGVTQLKKFIANNNSIFIGNTYFVIKTNLKNY